MTNDMNAGLVETDNKVIVWKGACASEDYSLMLDNSTWWRASGWGR